MKLALELALVMGFVLSVSTVWPAAIPIAIALFIVILWPEDRPIQFEREELDDRARQEARVEAAFEALRGLARDYPRPRHDYPQSY